jgi:hypothetical protein
MDTINTTQITSSLANIVRMWEAPVTGDIQINNSMSLSQNSQDGVDVWIEKGGMTKANEDNSAFSPSNSTLISSVVTLSNSGQTQNLSAGTHVEKGQRIFIIASSKTDPDGDKINVNTNIDVSSSFLQLFGITKAVITDYSFTQREGNRNEQVFDINMLSDTTTILDFTEEDAADDIFLKSVLNQNDFTF